ncbi:MAG: RagB/SusD family nutrient uptake outer membrane protein, partial [Chitinophagaceae bacterium]
MITINKHTSFKLYLSFIAIATAIVFFSCKKFVDIDPPVNQVISNVVFTSDGMATSAVTGIYSEMMSSSGKFSAGEVTIYAGLSADELTTASNNNREEFLKNQITIFNHPTLLSVFWDKAYKFIYTANVCLEGLEQSSDLTPSLKTKLIGECKFVRAFCYFHLINLFGDVPLTTVSDYRINAVLPRTDKSSIYQQMVADLKDAKRLLTPEYPTADRVRPNKRTAAALLARVYLYRNEWANAEAEADSIISDGNYTLEDSLNKVFKKTSTEAIWQLMPVNTTFNNTWEGNIFIPPQTTSFYLTNTLLNSFEPGDSRRIIWVGTRNISPTEIRYYPLKYTVKLASTTSEYYMVFRLA